MFRAEDTKNEQTTSARINNLYHEKPIFNPVDETYFGGRETDRSQSLGVA